MPPRRSKRLSAEDAAKQPQGGDDHSPEEPERAKPTSPVRKAARAPSRPRRRSTREKGGSAAVARNALADINRGPECPIFLLSQELLKKIWEFLDSKTKMTTTVRTLCTPPSQSPPPFSTCSGLSGRCLLRRSLSASGGKSSAGRPRSSASSSPMPSYPSPWAP
jgi:hypothetical protein